MTTLKNIKSISQLQKDDKKAEAAAKLEEVQQRLVKLNKLTDSEINRRVSCIEERIRQIEELAIYRCEINAIYSTVVHASKDGGVDSSVLDSLSQDIDRTARKFTSVRG